MEKWRKYFKGAGTDICSVIEYAILVAASDCPNEFRRRRDRISQRLFSSRFNCDYVTLVEPHEDIVDDQNQDDIKGCHAKDNGKVNRCTSKTDVNSASKYNHKEAEALTEEIEEQTQVLKEVFRIKDILLNLDQVVFLLS